MSAGPVWKAYPYHEPRARACELDTGFEVVHPQRVGQHDRVACHMLGALSLREALGVREHGPEVLDDEDYLWLEHDDKIITAYDDAVR